MHRLCGQTTPIDGMVAAGVRAAVVLIGLLLAAGCTHPQARTQATPAEPQQHGPGAMRIQQVAATTAAKTFRFAMTIHSEGGGLTPTTNTAQGALDHANHQGWSDWPGRNQGHPGERWTLLIGTTLYQRSSGPKQWLKLDRAEPGANLGLLGGNVVDPSPLLGLLRDGAQAATRVGAARVRGVRTDRYAVMLDLDHYVTTLSPQGRRLAKQYGMAGRIPAEVWVDAQSRLRRLHFRVGVNVPSPTPAPGATGGRATEEFTVELFDFGVPVHVSPPPADQVCAKPVCYASPPTTP